MAERVQTYLDAPFERVREASPEWHPSVYAAPTYDNVRTLPHVLQALAFVFRPSADPLTEDQWPSTVTGGGYDSFGFGDGTPMRAPDDDGREVSNADSVDPDFGPGRTHGRLAPGVPADGFKAYPEAFHNRDDYRGGVDGPLSVTVVADDTDVRRRTFDTTDGPGIRDETDATAEHYRRRADEPNVAVEVRENLTTAELARVFESANDLVHFHRSPRRGRSRLPRRVAERGSIVAVAGGDVLSRRLRVVPVRGRVDPDGERRWRGDVRARRRRRLQGRGRSLD